ncbi:lipid II flippase MurJ [Bifidobacterium criceti]|uniref:MviN-like protein n=1 Tax=Bifidobacterium criceti TaxID=1960969 RepID=A0A2A2EJ65_9BIFI|nr:lipid II flippase MurJ [Bifidobacterium criceti]PAU69047.1 MviN-like protein [Bifidobacterium criceti]
MSSSVGRNSLIMASGTAASRITGQIRTILLAAAIGTTGLAANAYQAGSMIPQVIYTLVSGGIFNAVLVPHIVRTLHSDNAEEQLNKIVTFAVTLLLGVTVLMAVLTPWITRLYVSGGPELISLACSFTLWCTPQIFFYGLYTVLGQILAVKNKFGAYAWSSVGANVISCIGFTLFIVLFGNHSQSSAGQWTTPKIALTAGMWTLGVMFQALILFVPLLRSGFRFHLRFGVRGIGLRTMGPIAAWSLGIVCIDQIANIISTRVLTAAPSLAERTMHMSQFDVAGNATYQNAYTIYLLPYSLIAVSVATAIFPQISAAIADDDLERARGDLSSSLRTVGIIMFLFMAAFLVMPLAITRSLLPTVSVGQAILMCGPLMGLSVCLPLASAYLIIQRTFYAFEDGRSPFTFMAIMYALQLGSILLCTRVLPPTQWAAAIGVCVSVSYLISFVPLVHMLRKRFDGSLDGRRIALTYGKACTATVVACVIGFALRRPLYRLLHVDDPMSAGAVGWLRAVGAAAVLFIVIVAVYLAVLWLLRTEELTQVVVAVRARLGRVGAADTASAEGAQGVQDGARTDSVIDDAVDDEERAFDAAHGIAFDDDSTRVIPELSRIAPAAPIDELAQLDPPVPAALAEPPIALSANVARPSAPPTTADSRMTVQTSSRPYESGDNMKPHLGDTILNRYTLVSPLREEAGLQVWKSNDRVLSRDCQLFIVNNRAVLENTNAIAGTLAASHDPRFTQVIQLQHDGDIAVILTRLDAGVSLTEYMRDDGATPPVLSYEAMRTIIGESMDAVRVLQKDRLTHNSLSTDTVRLTRNGVQLADTPVSAALADTANTPAGYNDERRAIRQLAGVLYGMLTRTPSTMHPRFSLDALPEDAPVEFHLIVKRGLELSDGVKPTVPLVTMAEMDALLGARKPLHALTRHDVRLTGVDGECSIVRAMIQPALPGDILPIPDSMVSSQTMPSMMFPAQQLDPDSLAELEEETAEKQGQADGDQASGRSFKALWNKSKAIMGGTDDTGAKIPEISPNDATEMFTAFDPNAVPETPMTPSRMTVPIDVSPVRDSTINTSSAATPMSATATGHLPAIDEDGNELPDGSQSQRELRKEREDIDATYVMGAPALPPSFAPQERPKTQAPSNLNDEQPKKKKTGRAAVIIVVALAVATALGFAIHSLATSGSLFGFGKQDTTYWPDADLDDVPFGERNGGEVKTPDATGKQSDAPKPTQTPSKAPNNTAYPVASQQFLDRPAGQQGYGYYLHLQNKENVDRIVVSIRSSGGKGFVYANATADNPTGGEQVAEFTFADGGTTEVKFTKPVETQDLIMWVPLDSLPGNQLYINSVKAF